MREKTCTTELAQFRQELYQNFNNRADSLMELVDALCSTPNARSVVELSLTPCFRRTHTALYKAIAACEWCDGQLAQLLAAYLPQPQKRRFWLLAVDVTPQARHYARHLADRSMVYQAQVVKGNKPVTIGHQYSTVALLPEAEAGLSSSWVVPLMTQRVGSAQDKELVAASQIDYLLNDSALPFGDELCVEVGDSSYSKPAYLHANRQHPNLVSIARVRSNRILYRQFEPNQAQAGAGHPNWYGARFSLQERMTWPQPDQQVTTTHVSHRGKPYRVEIQAWHNLLMRGKRKPQPLSMQRHPFTLVRIMLYDASGRPAFRRPLWLIVIGARRHELSLLDIYAAYTQRFDLEHFFRFGKQKLLLADFQTPDTAHEESWWQLVHIAYAQLWLARHVAHYLPRPWERHLHIRKARRMSPALVQRDFSRIIRQMGTPAKPPKPRGYSPGRPRGTRLPPRPRHKVIVKSQQSATSL